MYLLFLTLFCTQSMPSASCSQPSSERESSFSKPPQKQQPLVCIHQEWPAPTSVLASQQPLGTMQEPPRQPAGMQTHSVPEAWCGAPNRNNGDHLGQSESLGENSHVSAGRVSHLQQWWKVKEARRESWVRGSKEEAGTEQKSNEIEEKRKRVKVSVRAAEKEVTRGSRQVTPHI